MPLIEPISIQEGKVSRNLIEAHLRSFPGERRGRSAQFTPNPAMADPLLTVEDVGRRLNVSKDWVWDHCWRKTPKRPVIRMGDVALRFRASAIEEFINERERVSSKRSQRR